MKLVINLEKKYFFALLLAGLIFIGTVGVFAYSSAGVGGVASTFGHSIDEIDWNKTISGTVKSSGGFCIGSSCITSWSGVSGGGSGSGDFAGVGMKLTKVSGVNPNCTKGSMILSKKYSEKTCTSIYGCSSYSGGSQGGGVGGGYSLSNCTVGGWGDPDSSDIELSGGYFAISDPSAFCSYEDKTSYGSYSCTDKICDGSDSWTEVLCLGSI